eukprot:TRINITY_DN3878_c0_g1_i1.p1 TRINITY_DN3878_c0_g1~~TRINITY_DN3878_c0_g1_i1.p1  ORF type:complete len:449 (+),score=100.84 TRINITY_DN3878_c0_g1_i1:2327-3673(+)
MQQVEDNKKLMEAIKSEIQDWANEIVQLWNKYLEFIILIPHQIAEQLLEEYNRLRLEYFKHFIITTTINIQEFPYLALRDIGGEHQAALKSIRSIAASKAIYNYPIRECNVFDKLSEVPILFEEVFTPEHYATAKCTRLDSAKEPSIAEPKQGKGNLLVFVHGFQGSSQDIVYVKNVMFLRLPSCQTLCSESNQGKTEGCIEEMGETLAKEVITYIKEWFPGNSLQRILFFGHSLGGIIIRSCLPRLKEYKEKMHLLLTFSTPHLGYLHQSSRLIGAGMWFLKKWTTSKALSQLEMTDSKSGEKSFIYRLSQVEGMEWFKHVILVSSFLDLYSPYESSRIEIGKKHKSDTLYIKMGQNILTRLKAASLHRVDVGFNIKKNNLNSFIGREAHLQFLENEVFLKIVAYYYADIFTNCTSCTSTVCIVSGFWGFGVSVSYTHLTLPTNREV